MSGALGWLRARLGVRVVTSLAAALSVAVVLLLVRNTRASREGVVNRI